MLFEAIAQLNQKYTKIPTGKTKKVTKPMHKGKQLKGKKTQQRKFAISNTRRRRQAIKKMLPAGNGGANNGGY